MTGHKEIGQRKSRLRKWLKYGILCLVFLFILTSVVPYFFRHIAGGQQIVDSHPYKWTKSDQPERDYLSFSRKWIVKLSHADSFLRVIFQTALDLPLLLWEYRAIRADLYQQKVPITESHFSLAVSVDTIDMIQLDRLIDELGTREVLVRVPFYKGRVFSQMDQDRITKGIQHLADKGLGLTLSILQSREAVNNIPEWKKHVKQIIETFSPVCRHFIIGHAPNRGKWGIWDFGMHEYTTLLKTAREVATAYPEVKLIGPSVIDFEWQYMNAILHRLDPGDLDIINSLLYVDRRGAPENLQGQFDTPLKVAFITAIARHYKKNIQLWITEVNWPLSGHGPYSPASDGENEEDYANYLVRYNILTACTGMVERIYWWQLVAKGYGLVDDSGASLRKRPGFYAMKTLREQLIGSTFISRRVQGGTHTFTFRKNSGHIHVIWTTAGKETLSLSRKGRVITRDGKDAGLTSSLLISGEPVYVHVPAD